MNITEMYDLEAIIRELELIMQLDGQDFEEKSFDVIVDNVRNRISRQYQVDLTGCKLSTVNFEIGQQRNVAQLFLSNISQLHAKLCGCCQVFRFQTSMDLSLSKVNYLGFTCESLVAALKALQCKKVQVQAEEGLNAIRQKLPSVSMCKEKRLFVLLVLTYELGMEELTAAIAELLYLCHVVRI